MVKTSEKKAVRKRLAQSPADEKHHKASDFTRSVGTSGQRSEVASFKAIRPFAIDARRPFDLSVVATETFTTDGTADNTETFSLSNDIVDSEVVADSLVLYEGDGTTPVQPDSVDYSADSFDYTSSGTDTTLTAYYTSGEQASLEVQKVAPNGTVETLWSDDVGMVHRRDHSKDPLRFDFADLWQATVPTDFTLEIYVDAPYTATLVGQDGDGGGTVEPATNAMLDVPYVGAPGEIPGLQRVVRAEMAQR